MSRNRALRYGLVLMSLVLVVIAGAFLTVQINAQNQSAALLFQRLTQKGVPVESVAVASRIPFQIEITLQSSSDSQNVTFDDAWFMQLARREATLAYRLGMRVNSYTLTVLNSTGEKIAWEQNYLYPSDLSQQPVTPVVPRVDDAVAERLVAERLRPGDMSLDMLEVSSDATLADGGQILFIQVSVLDLDVANRSLLTFLDSLFRMLDTINAEEGTHLVLCRLRLVDRQGSILLDYVQDLETHQQQWSAVKGLTNEWYPHPPDETPSAPPRTSTPTPPFISPLPTPTTQVPQLGSTLDDGAAQIGT